MSPTVEVQVTWLNQVPWQPSSFPQILYLKLELLMLREEKKLWMKFGPSLSTCCCCSVTKSCLTLCDLMDCSMPGSSVLHYLWEFAQTHIHWVSDVIQPSHPLSPPSPSALNISQHQGLFQWVASSHQMAKLLGHQLKQQSFHWIFRVDFL